MLVFMWIDGSYVDVDEGFGFGGFSFFGFSKCRERPALLIDILFLLKC